MSISKVVNIVKNYSESFCEFLFPSCCVCCSNVLLKGESSICMHCLIDIPKSKAVPRSDDNKIEEVFWGRVRLEWATAFFDFTKGSRYQKLLHVLKYQGNKEVGFVLGRQLGIELYSYGVLQEIDLIIPVPLHAKKLKKRGFNQSRCIADGLASIMNTTIDVGNLVRIVHTETQTKKGRNERWLNVKDAFHVVDEQVFNGQHILLIDDVLTTGATMEACAQKLLGSCNCKVSIAAVAYANR